MLRLAIGLAVILAAVAVAPAQEPVGWAHKLLAKDGKPLIEHDFGTAPQGAQLQERFPVTNIYSVPLQFQLRVSCDCVTVTLSQHTLQPKESGYLDVTMDTRRFTGAKVVTIFMTVVHPQYTSTAVFNVKGFCRTDVVLNPGTVNMGFVPQGTAGTGAVDIDYSGRHPNWQITGAPVNDLFKIEVIERYRQPGRVGYRMQLTLKPTAPAGSFKKELVLTTNDPTNVNLAIPYEITVQSPLTVFPANVRFPSARVGTLSEYRVSVKSSGKPFRVTSVEGLDEGLSIGESLPSSEPRPVHIFTIKYLPNSAGTLAKKLVFQTDAGWSATVTVEGAASAP